MYDPLIVDAFISVHQQIAPDPLGSGIQRLALVDIAGKASATARIPVTNHRLDEIAASSDEMLTLYDLSRSMAEQSNSAAAIDLIAQHLKRLIPSSLLIFYSYESDRDELRATHAIGDPDSIVRGLRIALGQRLSGWVAANRQTIVNSDPVLDLGDIARSINPRLRNCLSAPLVADSDLIGVLTLYSSSTDGFSDEHRRVIELIAREMARPLKRAIEFDKSSHQDSITGLPNLERLNQVDENSHAQNVDRHSTTALIIDVVGMKKINSTYGRQIGDDVLRHVVQRTKQALRLADMLFRYESDELVAIVNNADPDTVQRIVERICDSVRLTPVSTQDGTSIHIVVNVEIIRLQKHGDTFAQMIEEARPPRLTPIGKESPSTVH
jgi:diguanylate cyclase (GGDEF)-like protein